MLYLQYVKLSDENTKRQSQTKTQIKLSNLENNIIINILFLGERKNQTENLRRTLTEIEYAKEREDRLKKDLEVNKTLKLTKCIYA